MWARVLVVKLVVVVFVGRMRSERRAAVVSGRSMDLINTSQHWRGLGAMEEGAAAVKTARAGSFMNGFCCPRRVLCDTGLDVLTPAPVASAIVF